MAAAKVRIPVWAALIGSGLAGMLVAGQSRINGGLSQHIDNAYVTAAYSFGSGLIVIAVVMACSPRAKQGWRELVAEVRAGRFPWWALFGGTGGALFVLSQGLIATVIGVALFTVGIVAGQVLGGLAMDRVGLGPGGRVSPTVQRIIGTVLAVCAVLLTVWAELAGGGSSSAWLVVVPLIAGIAMAWQSAVNGLVRSASHSAVTATFVSFFVGTVVLVIAAIVSVFVLGLPTGWPASPVFYVGGAAGVVFIAIASVLVRSAGVLLLSMSNVAGQLIASVFIEAGLPLADGVTGWLIAGAALALVAVVIAAVPSRRGREGRAVSRSER